MYKQRVMNTINKEFAAELDMIRREREQKKWYYQNKADMLIASYNEEFNHTHNLDKTDVAICTAAGTIGGVIDLLFIGIPHSGGRNGVEGGCLDGIVRDWFDRRFPEVDMEVLANQAKTKVSYDAQDNRNTSIYVDGLSAYYHRLLSLGHDPFLGFFVGVYDILNGKMTTIDESGNFTSQKMEVYARRKTTQILDAIKREYLHLKSDVNTRMGLPVPLMALFDTLQFGHLGDNDLTVAEVVKGMYYEGYDFQHFCAMSIPCMLTEIVVRAAWWIRMKKEGHSLFGTTPVWTSRNRTSKLDTMLTLAHLCFCTVNAVKVGVTKNPCAINFPEWLRFSNLLIKEARWQLVDKSTARLSYVTDRICEL